MLTFYWSIAILGTAILWSCLLCPFPDQNVRTNGMQCFDIGIFITHYNDVIMGAIASQITSLTIVYSIICSDADQRKHQSSASLVFVRGIHRGPVNSPPTNGQLRGKCFHLMTSSWRIDFSPKLKQNPIYDQAIELIFILECNSWNIIHHLVLHVCY